jgi:hypothetical protein
MSVVVMNLEAIVRRDFLNTNNRASTGRIHSIHKKRKKTGDHGMVQNNVQLNGIEFPYSSASSS